MKSMTGFGRSHYFGDHHSVTVEVRAVNHRFLEWTFRIPQELNRYEDNLKKIGKELLHRGKLDVTITINKEVGKGNRIVVDQDAMDQLYLLLQQMKSTYKIEDSITYNDLLRVNETYYIQEGLESNKSLEPILTQVFKEAIDALVQMRISEGANLKRELKQYVFEMIEMMNQVETLAPTIVSRYEERLKNKLEQLALPEELEPRWIQEVAVLADKVDIAEEIGRLKSHFTGFLAVLEEEGSVGRTIEFYLQEIHREINTIGSKANHAQIAQVVVSLKSILEKMREQAQNIE
ncbi:YicC/YloC family endoribonuclease [Mangrovibacillus cuniculi]|uniref:YicC family protein n=1 Tax=Mangrovibacillus cuniculi TaxID=2593652 RepID=A0A7S8CAB0_9BACI|nr:YicC/YloC family endoribonuclease [Mangrovibacillus cuniculi]QPC46290.1 YicC family protein [Mangrovibacillus cuniculi]